MRLKYQLLPLLTLLLSGLSTIGAMAETRVDQSRPDGKGAQELEWPDLVPQGAGLEKILQEYRVYELEDDDPQAAEVFARVQEYLDNAPVKEEMDGRRVRLPGYVIPLDGDGNHALEFLLVPYFGACIHVPPPPSNQIIYGRSEQEVPVEELFDAVWVTGVLRVERVQDDLATAGYSMEVEEVEPYQE